MAILQGCTVEDKNPCDLSLEVLTELNRVDSLINDSLINHRAKQWMKYNYDEPSIFFADRETYRFSMNCSGSGNYSKIVRIEKSSDGHFNAVIKEFDGPTGSPETKGTIHVFQLENDDWESIKDELKIVNFWTSLESCDKQLLHGCTWYIESYHPEKNKCTMKNFHRIGGCYPVDSTLVSIHDFFDKLNKK